jgi:GT2 family glycosyltransferase
MTPTVSVVICCHNGANRLPETLAHLAAQRLEPALLWEVLVIDNASTDATAQVARRCWPRSAPAPLRVVPEPQLGLSYARRRGFAAAQGEIIILVDDDNWCCPDWVQLAVEVMAQHPEVGACGGQIEAAMEKSAPPWFERFEESYAVGAQGDAAGDVTETRGYLWGAGLCIRQRAWRQVAASGFQTSLVDRRGAALSAGEDAELCFALRSFGWRLWYEPRLRMRHFIPAGRAEWRYLRQLKRGFGAATVGHDPYHASAGAGRARWSHPGIAQSWTWQTLRVLICLLLHRPRLLLAWHRAMEGDAEVLRMEAQIGRLQELLRGRQDYARKMRAALDGQRVFGNPCARGEGGVRRWALGLGLDDRPPTTDETLSPDTQDLTPNAQGPTPHVLLDDR